MIMCTKVNIDEKLHVIYSILFKLNYKYCYFIVTFYLNVFNYFIYKKKSYI